MSEFKKSVLHARTREAGIENEGGGRWEEEEGGREEEEEEDEGGGGRRRGKEEGEEEEEEEVIEALQSSSVIEVHPDCTHSYLSCSQRNNLQLHSLQHRMTDSATRSSTHSEHLTQTRGQGVQPGLSRSSERQLSSSCSHTEFRNGTQPL